MLLCKLTEKAEENSVSRTYEREQPCRKCGGREFYSATNRCAPCQRSRVSRTAPAVLEGAFRKTHEVPEAEFSAFVDRARAAAHARYGADAAWPTPRGRSTAGGLVRFDFFVHSDDLPGLLRESIRPAALPETVVGAARVHSARVGDFAALVEGLLRVRYALAPAARVDAGVTKRGRQVAGPAGTLMVDFVAHPDDVQALQDWAADTWARPATRPMQPDGIVYDGPMATPGPERLS